MLVGYMEKAQAYSPVLTSFSSSAVPRMPPTKFIRVLVRGSLMPKIGSSTYFCSKVTSSFSMGSVVAAKRGQIERAPLSLQIQPQLVLPRGRRRSGRFDDEHAIQ